MTNGGDIGEALVRDPLVAMVSVSGSARTGQSVMATAVQSAKRVHLELGGKAPALAFADADVDAQARAVTLGATDIGPLISAAHRNRVAGFVERAVRRGRPQRPSPWPTTVYGLASSVWTVDVARTLRVSHHLDVGVTWINDHLPIALGAPHGGVKGSGVGKDMSHEALLEYSVTRHVMIKYSEPVHHDSFRPA